MGEVENAYSVLVRKPEGKVLLWRPIVDGRVITSSMEQSHLLEANNFSATQGITLFYGTQRFITAFSRVCAIGLDPEPDKSSPCSPILLV
jgi:hypothetical protein